MADRSSTSSEQAYRFQDGPETSLGRYALLLRTRTVRATHKFRSTANHREHLEARKRSDNNLRNAHPCCYRIAKAWSIGIESGGLMRGNGADLNPPILNRVDSGRSMKIRTLQMYCDNSQMSIRQMLIFV